MLHRTDTDRTFRSLARRLETRTPDAALDDPDDHRDDNPPRTVSEPLIRHRIETDKYGNGVSIIRLANGGYFRMVHHSAERQTRQKATIYAGRGKFVRVETYYSNNDCALVTIKIAGYETAWGDGDPLTPVNNPAGPDLTAALQHIFDDDFDAVILTVLDAIQDRDDLWEHKTLA